MSSQQARISAVLDQTSRSARSVPYPKDSQGRPLTVSEVFAENVFTLKTMQQHLPKPVFNDFIHQMKGNKCLSKATSDAIAHAVRTWASQRGATHFTHLFQPQTDTTAEKHDSFLTLKSVIGSYGEEVVAIDAFSGSQLLQAEPDASSFPNGGVRNTFEARGYTVWDTTSPMYLQDGPNDTKVLYIPSVFISYNGEALDEKTVLLRSVDAINKSAVKLLNLIGHKDVKRVIATLGTEQEFFLLDRNLYALRPDLKIAGRTLIGSLPPKHQQMEDHYFGRIPSRVLSTISEAELELYKLGVPIKTRHNEVAPAQFEVAPIFEEAPLAVDHNLLTMEVLHRVAHRHKLKVLFHEKPFSGINGSGKHCNWSMSTDTGVNLLDPTANPRDNPVFLLFLVAVINAVHNHSALLRCGIASASNDHRLGGNEAPPSIISVFLGEQLTEVLDSIEQNREVKKETQPKFRHIKVGGTSLDVKVATLPEIARDLTDRNRTSPFAFTGNKFEFRAVGAKQSPSFPVTLVNAAVAASITEITDVLEKKVGAGKTPTTADIMAVLKDYIVKTKAIRFEGDGYSAEWHAEAQRRGLPNIRCAPEAFRVLLDPKHQKMLTEVSQIFSPEELNSRYHILSEKYAKDILIEANTLKSMLFTAILPMTFDTRKQMAESVCKLKDAGVDYNTEKKVLVQLGELLNQLSENGDKLVKNIDAIAQSHEEDADLTAARDLLPVMNLIRQQVDNLEGIVNDKNWPFPKYIELLFSI
ncbi:hypothetical protein MIR68_003908 [Amoeboaphelidium protococcarum]|nr:hypothetical protein MIR68_003908 [Amoeboaphelidium protococcarum]